MHHPDNGQRSYKPQTKYAERMILPGSSQKYSRTYLWVRGSWGTDCRKRQISSSSFFFLSSFSYKTCRTCILKTLTCQAEVFCWWYMQIMEPLQSLQARSTWLSCSSLMNTAPFSPEMMMSRWTRHQHCILNAHIIINGNRKKHQRLLLKGIRSGPGPPSCFLSWRGD